MKTGKTIVKRIILIAAAVIVVLIACDICMTEINAKKIPHRFASAEEGRELLLSSTEYYDHFTQIDIDIRMKKSGATMDELLKASTDEIRNFNIFEKYLMDRRIAKMARSLKKNHYELPKLEEIIYIKTDMAVEMGASGYTHGSCGMNCSTASPETILISERTCTPSYTSRLKILIMNCRPACAKSF